MSRIGNQKLEIPQGVTVQLQGEQLTTTGPKGSLRLTIPQNIKIEVQDKKIVVTRAGEHRKIKALQGCIRSQLNNNILGVTVGWSKTLQLVGVGFKGQTDGRKLTLNIGYSHPVDFAAPDGISLAVAGNDVTIAGPDKQAVGETAARIRRIKPPEVYKGKGIRYKNEVVRLKPGKAAKTVGGAAGTTK